MAGDAPFEEAYAAVQAVEDVVTQQIAASKASSDEFVASANSAITALGAISFGATSPPPTAPTLEEFTDIDFTLPAIGPNSFGRIDAATLTPPVLDTGDQISPLVIEPFNSDITINIPEAPPDDATLVIPDAPTVAAITLPNTPALAMPNLPTLVDITIPTFEGLDLPTFDATAPEFEGTALPGILQWSEPTYQSVILDEVIDKVRSLWSGGSGIPPAVEQAMFDRAAEREEITTSRDIDAVSTEFSLRGFTMPPGMQAARTDQMIQDLSTKKLGLNRELTIQVAQWQVENVRFACTTGIAAENVYVNLFTNAAQRMFEAARFQIESQISIYNAQIAVFNARMNGYQIRAQVFDTLVKAELSKIEVFKVQIEAEVAKGQVNVQKVQAYTAQVQALQTYVEIYKAQMQGASIQAEVGRNQIEAYKATVQAYAEKISAQKNKFEAYTARVNGAAAQANIVDAQARGYAAMVQGKVAINDGAIKVADLTIERNKIKLQQFMASQETERTRIQSVMGTIQAAAQAYTADTQRYAAEAGAKNSAAQAQIAAKEATMRSNIAYYQAQVQQYLGLMDQSIRQTAVVLDGLKAAGSISSTLAAGAMSAVHVGANLSGGGNVSASGSTSYSDSYSKSDSNSVSKSTTITYEGTGSP